MPHVFIQRFMLSGLGISLLVALAVISLAFFSATFPLLSQERMSIAQGEWWRLLTCHFVHFGWAHSLMNLAAFAIFAVAFAHEFSIQRFVALILFCGAAVGCGVYFLNPEYEIYAGLSGALHGFFVAALLLNRRHSFWLNGALVAALFGKVLIEHQPDYQATELQTLLPVKVAYDAHMYGALAGLIFGLSHLIFDKYFKHCSN